ncbi:MAG: hypothetical protein H6939_10115 [Burkholderiales bacterium]|nr:hypothetical protein [Burkholderiales bacterium]HQU62800.1 hypothetical protein [Nitrosomonas sp.]
MQPIFSAAESGRMKTAMDKRLFWLGIVRRCIESILSDAMAFIRAVKFERFFTTPDEH